MLSRCAVIVPWSGNRSAAEWGKVVSQTERGLSSPPWCTPRHRPGSPRLSSGFLWRRARLYPSAQPASPEKSRREVNRWDSRSWLTFLNTQMYVNVFHLAKAALAQNHDEVEVGKLDAVLIAVAVVLADRGRGRGVCGLPWTYLRSLEKGGKRRGSEEE